MNDELIPVDDALPTTSSRKRRTSKRSSAESVLFGLLVDVGGSLLTTRLFAWSLVAFGLTTGYFWPTLFMVWGFVIGLAGLFAGAFLAATLAPSRPLLHAAAVGVLDLLVSWVFFQPALLTTIFVVYIALALPATFSAGALARWIEEPSTTKRLRGSDPSGLLT